MKIKGFNVDLYEYGTTTQRLGLDENGKVSSMDQIKIAKTKREYVITRNSELLAKVKYLKGIKGVKEKIDWLVEKDVADGEYYENR